MPLFDRVTSIDSSPAAPVWTLEADPPLDGAYLFTTQVAGAAGTTTHIALSNPAGSGKTVFPLGLAISAFTTGAATDANGPIVSTATYSSGGTDQAASIGKPNSTYPDPSGILRTGNPTLTGHESIYRSPPPVATGASSIGFVYEIPLGAVPGGFTLLEGESIAIRTLGGETNQRYIFSLGWMEL